MLRLLNAFFRRSIRVTGQVMGYVGSIREKRLERVLKNQTGHSFTSDWTSFNYRNWSRWFAAYRDVPDLRILEIGSYEGRSAVWFLENVLTNAGSRLVCVDPMLHVPNPTRPRFLHNVQLTGKQAQVTFRQERSEIALLSLPPVSFDIIYIDGAHDAINVLTDGIYSWELLKVGGLLLFDDYLWRPDLPEYKRCQGAIDLLLKHFGARKTVIHKGAQVLIRKEAD